jgi:hypothetical protein
MKAAQESVERSRQAYRPATVRVLFVGESPPANGTFFYFGKSNLAQYTHEAFERVYGQTTDPQEFLEAFRERGFYLVDLCQTPVNRLVKRARRAARRAGVEELTGMLRELRPDRIVVVMKAIEPAVMKAVEAAGLQGTPVDVLPFPAYGHQREYVEKLAALLKRIGRRAGEDALVARGDGGSGGHGRCLGAG